VDLRAHLGRPLAADGLLSDATCLLDGVGERLLAVDVFVEFEGRQCGEGVGMLGGADNDGIEAVGVVVEPAKICEALGLGEPLGGRSRLRSSTSTRATMSSLATLPRLPAPRPPTPMAAMRSLSLARGESAALMPLTQ